MSADCEMPSFRRFVLVRYDDVHGNTGVGVVAYGAVFPNGRAILSWAGTPLIPQGATGVYESLQTLMDTHGHNGRTVVSFVDRSEPAVLVPSTQRVQAIADHGDHQVLAMG